MLALLAGEAALRAFFPMGACLLASDRYRTAENPEIGYELLPLAMGANRDGLRERERSVDKPEGVVRVLALGDSVAYGWGVERDQAWPGALERLLNQGRPGPGRFEVLNLGVPGYGIGQIVERFREKGIKYRPDLVVYGFWLDDASRGFDSIEQALFEGRRNRDLFSTSPWGRWAASQAVRLQITRRILLLVRRVRAAREAGKLAESGVPALRISPGVLAAWADFSRRYARGEIQEAAASEPYFRAFANLPTFVPWNQRMAELARLCRDLGAPCVVLLTPAFVDTEAGAYPFRALNAFVSRIAELHGMRVLDATAAFAGIPPREAGIGDQEHPSPTGHGIIARELAGFLRREFPGLF